jgi:Predicted hydrolases or acyltransferases (alpha/beta hydrolase superfamily)
MDPDGFVVVVEPGDRIHFLDWGSPGPQDGTPGRPGILLIHGLSNTAWTWAPVARRVQGVRRVVALDLRGHGLSDAPTEAYTPDLLAEDVVAVAEGSGLLTGAGAGLLSAAADRVVLVGHGFGAIVAAWTAEALDKRCAALVLVDGGWADLATATGMDADEFLRGLDEPPEVMRSLDAFLADRAAFDPTTWDADQDRAARATIVETHAGRVVPATRPHALEACVRTMFEYDPEATLAAIRAPVVALVARDDEGGSRGQALARVSATREAAGLAPIRAVSFGQDGHNLMRYRPEAVTAAILEADTRG